MDSHQIKLVQGSFEKIAPLGSKVAEAFYSELFKIDPSLRGLFKGNAHEQYDKLLTALAMVIRNLHTPQTIVHAAETLAKRHVDYGVKPEHYTLVGNALLRTLRKALGAEFTPELCDAWTEAFRGLARLMKQAAYDPGKPAAAPAQARSNAA